MAFVSVPRDLSQVKTKVFFNLTKRQLVCLGSGALCGLPVFFLLRNSLSSSTASVLMILTMLPFFILGMYEHNGQPLEKLLQSFIMSRFVRPKKRPYRTENIYSLIAQQIQINKEVQNIVRSSEKVFSVSAEPKRKKAAGCHSGKSKKI